MKAKHAGDPKGTMHMTPEQLGQFVKSSHRLSKGAAVLFDAMGRGFRMRVPHNGDPAQFINTRPEGYSPAVVGCGFSCNDPAVLQELMESGLITKLTEIGEPPLEKRTKKDPGYRVGWREVGYDGDVADWWVCTQ